MCSIEYSMQLYVPPLCSIRHVHTRNSSREKLTNGAVPSSYISSTPSVSVDNRLCGNDSNNETGDSFSEPEGDVTATDDKPNYSHVNAHVAKHTRLKAHIWLTAGTIVLVDLEPSN